MRGDVFCDRGLNAPGGGPELPGVPAKKSPMGCKPCESIPQFGRSSNFIREGDGLCAEALAEEAAEDEADDLDPRDVFFFDAVFLVFLPAFFFEADLPLPVSVFFFDFLLVPLISSS